MQTSKSSYWIQVFQQKIPAYWKHDGRPNRPHALLTSGKHSDGFFNAGKVLENTDITAKACAEMANSLSDAMVGWSNDERGAAVDLTKVDRVVGPAMGAITLAHELAHQIGNRRGFACLTAYLTKVLNDDGGLEKFEFPRIKPKKDEKVLLTEDVLTTGGSTKLAAEAVRNAGARVLPFVVVIVNRSGLSEVAGLKIVALVDKEMTNWEDRLCPLCRQGSEAIRPKEAGNWARLTAM